MTAKELWDVANTEKFSTLAINVAKEILKNVDEIDELYEWLDKKGRSWFANEEEVYEYVKEFLSELMIVECQNYIDSSPYEHAHKVIDRINDLKDTIGSLPDKAKVLLSLANAYLGKRDGLAEQVIQDE